MSSNTFAKDLSRNHIKTKTWPIEIEFDAVFEYIKKIFDRQLHFFGLNILGTNISAPQLIYIVLRGGHNWHNTAANIVCSVLWTIVTNNMLHVYFGKLSFAYESIGRAV